MVTFVKRNIGFLAFYLVLIGGVLLITTRFSTYQEKPNSVISLNK